MDHRARRERGRAHPPAGRGASRSPDDPWPTDFDVLAWDDFNSPNEVPGIQFTTRVQHFIPNEPSALGITAFNGRTRRDGHVRPRKVVLNGGLPDLRGYPAGGVL